jgi:hypothetical protein
MTLEMVIANASRYELGPLLVALELVGVPLSRVYFDGRPVPEHGEQTPLSRPRLAPEGRSVLAARVRGAAGEPSVVVHLPGGLLGPLSPLPSYFQRLLGEEVLAESLGALLHVLDDSLFRARARYADGKRALFPRGSLDPRLGEALVNSSPLYVDWLFRQVFPELRVQVARSALARPIQLDRVLLGSVALGHCALDGYTHVAGQSLDVTLTTSFDGWGGSPQSPPGRGETWAEEVRARLARHVFPQFQRHPLALRVVLRVLASQTQARVASSRVSEALVVTARPPFEFTLHAGHVPLPPAAVVSTSRRQSPRRDT